MSKFTFFIMVVCLSFGLAQAQEIIIDGTFENNGEAWIVEDEDGGIFSFEVLDDQARIIIEALGANLWSLQFKQKVTVLKGRKYDVSFDIMSYGADSIGIWIQQDHPDWVLVDEKTFHPTEEWQTFSYTSAEWDQDDDDNAKLSFVFRDVEIGDEIWIDNVSMSEEGTLPSNNDDFVHQLLKFSLSQNYPNPFNQETTIRFNIPRKSMISLKIFNMMGQEIVTLVNTEYQQGNYDIRWDGNDNSGNMVPGGFYIYRLEAEGIVKSNKMLLIK